MNRERMFLPMYMSDGVGGGDLEMVPQDTPANENVKVDSPTVESLQTELKRFDGVDVDHYKAVKDLNIADVNRALEIMKRAEENPELLKQLTDSKQTNDLEERLNRLERERIDQENKQQYDKFMQQTESSLAEELKKAGIEFISDGQDERDMIIKSVIEEFKQDEQYAQERGLNEGKLSWEDIPKVIAEKVQNLVTYRQAIQKSSVKKGAIPTEGGSPQAQMTENKHKSDADRRKELALELETIYKKT